MSRIKIDDLPVLQDLKTSQTKKILGGRDSTTNLVAHELTHVVQQSGDGTDGTAATYEHYDYPGVYVEKSKDTT